jgi:hypothetical protein
LHAHQHGDNYVTSQQVCILWLFPFWATADRAQAAASESIPPALLTRARNIALEHKTLTEKLANGFDSKSAKKLGEYSPIVSALETWDKANEVRRTEHFMAYGC